MDVNTPTYLLPSAALSAKYSKFVQSIILLHCVDFYGTYKVFMFLITLGAELLVDILTLSWKDILRIRPVRSHSHNHDNSLAEFPTP